MPFIERGGVGSSIGARAAAQGAVGATCARARAPDARTDRRRGAISRGDGGYLDRSELVHVHTHWVALGSVLSQPGARPAGAGPLRSPVLGNRQGLLTGSNRRGLAAREIGDR